MSDTIAAISTFPATAAIGVIRISGDNCFRLVLPLLKTVGGAPLPLPEFGKMQLCRIEAEQEVYDEAMATFFKAPRSYTGEDLIELSCHGGVYVLQGVLSLLLRSGCRMAEKGEFSKRAFLSGKLDLIRAQAVIDLIHAESAPARKNALSRLSGKLSSRMKGLYDALLSLNTALSAYVDFPDETEGEETDFQGKLQEILREIDRLLSGAAKGKILSEGLKCAIIGAPNAGKSTLLNALLGYDRAIVSAIPGTTRDLVREGCLLGGIRCILSDTAGIRETDDPIEKEGVSRARAEAADAQLIIVVFDGSRALSPEELRFCPEPRKPSVALINKSYLPQKWEPAALSDGFSAVFPVSAKEGSGLSGLEHFIEETFTPADAFSDGVLTGAAEIAGLNEAKKAVERALATLREGFTADLAAIDLAEAAGAVGMVTGDRVTDETIDRLFSTFCVGK